MSSIFYEIGLGYRLSAYTVDTDERTPDQFSKVNFTTSVF